MKTSIKIKLAATLMSLAVLGCGHGSSVIKVASASVAPPDQVAELVAPPCIPGQDVACDEALAGNTELAVLNVLWNVSEPAATAAAMVADRR